MKNKAFLYVVVLLFVAMIFISLGIVLEKRNIKNRSQKEKVLVYIPRTVILHFIRHQNVDLSNSEVVGYEFSTLKTRAMFDYGFCQTKLFLVDYPIKSSLVVEGTIKKNSKRKLIALSVTPLSSDFFSCDDDDFAEEDCNGLRTENGLPVSSDFLGELVLVKGTKNVYVLKRLRMPLDN